MSYLLIDAGNSRIKWMLCEDDGRLGLVSIASTLSQLQAAWQSMNAPTDIWLSSVRDEVFTAQLVNELELRWSVTVNQVSSAKHCLGVTNAYTEFKTLGCDRWVAMIAAYQAERSAVLVINAGTATTIDAVSHEGQHLGGLLLPGQYSMRQALLQNTNIKTQLLHPEQTPFFATSTDSAIQAGTLHATCGLIDEAYTRLAELGHRPVCYLAGGDAEDLTNTLQCPHIVEPHLVLKGLALLATQTQTNNL